MKNHSKFSFTWFFRWFLDNQLVTALVVSLLVFLNLFVLTKITFLFEPVRLFLKVIMLPMIISALLYYLMKPLVSYIEKLGAKRVPAIVIVFVVMASLIILGAAVFVPILEEQIMNFVNNLPDYIRTIEKEAVQLLEDERFQAYEGQLQELINTYSAKATDYAETISRSAVNWVGDLATSVAKVAVAIVMAPFILFYLLRDEDKLKQSILTFFPIKMRPATGRILTDVNKQLSGYVQGQVVVAVIVGILFAMMYSIIGLRYGVTFGIIAGFLNMIPYLGSFVAQIPVYIMALVQGPLMLVYVSIVFLIEQTIEGRFVSPMILGSKLNIHPITIMFILLAGGSLFGVWGVFLGIPIYASVKVIIKEIFEWYKSISGLYDEKLESEDMPLDVE